MYVDNSGLYGNKSVDKYDDVECGKPIWKPADMMVSISLSTGSRCTDTR